MCSEIKKYDFTEVDKVAKELIAEGLTPSIQMAVTKGQDLVYNKAHGSWANEKASVDTIYDLASVTKIMSTTQAAMMLYYQGKLDLEAPVESYLKGYGKNGKSHIKLKDLLTHTAGFKAWEPVYLRATNPEEVLDYLSNKGLDYETGMDRIYSDLGFMSLGFVIEAVAGMKINEFFRENIAKPLALNSTTYLPLYENKDFHIAPTSFGNPYEKRMIDDESLEHNCPENSADFKEWREGRIRGTASDCNTHHAQRGISGHAGLFSNTRELSVLTRLMLAGGEYKGVRLYDKKTFDEFTKIQSKFGHGYGFEIGRGSPEGGYMGYYANDDVVGHTGFSGTVFIVDKARDISVIILTNKQYNGLGEDGAYPISSLFSRPLIKAIYESGIVYK